MNKNEIMSASKDILILRLCSLMSMPRIRKSDEVEAKRVVAELEARGVVSADFNRIYFRQFYA